MRTRIPAVPALWGALLTACSSATLGRDLTVAYGSVAAMVAQDEVQIELKRSFLEAYKNRVTIEATFTVDAVAERVNPPQFDGDFHFAGRAPEIGLRLVAEILNPASVGAADSAVERIRQAHAAERPIRLTGAWRLWPEHAFGSREQQGRQAERIPNANPDHVFEIHPVTRADGIGLLDTFRAVDGYLPGNPRRTFGIYADAKYQLEVKPESVVLTVSTGLYNDVHFVLEVSAGRPQVVRDGRFVYAAALDDDDGTRLVERLRMVFLKDTAPERAIRSLKAGARLHVWGKPRVNFEEISRLIRESAQNPALLEGPLPYEMLIFAVYPADKEDQRLVPTPGA